MHTARGQTLAEFALALPVFLLIVLGLFDVGRAVFVYNGLTNAAREGARLAIVNQNPPDIAERAQAMAFGIAITNTPTEMVTFRRQSDGTACDPDDVAVGCIAAVEAEATWQAITPIVGSIVGPIDLTARSELPVEFTCPNPSITAYDAADECPKQPFEP